MAAISPRDSNKKDTRARLSEIKPSKPAPHGAGPSHRFEDVARHAIASSIRRSSTGMHHINAAPSLHPSESRSSNADRVRRNSLSDVVARTRSGAIRPDPHTGSMSHSGLQGKPASGHPASTSSKVSRSNELCKDCRSRISRTESICFISNDGRISAAPTGALQARHSHHCNVQGCARNQSHCQPPSPSSRRNSLPKKQALLINPQPTRRKSVNVLSGTGDQGYAASFLRGDDCKKQGAELNLRHSTKVSSTTGSDGLDMKKEIDLKEVSIKFSEDDEGCVNTDSPRHMPVDQNGRIDAVSACQEHSSSCSPTPRIPVDQGSYVENTHVEHVELQSSPAASPSSILLDIHGDDDVDKHSAHRDDIQALNDFQSLISYHGDNEYSCSEGGTGTTTTPISSSKGAFDDLSNLDIQQSHSEHEMVPQSRRSAFARITRKYLESLTEQEAEKVRLRRAKEIMARKQAGDWMLDCHMGEVLNRLAPTGEAHVKVLVEAFETVMHQSDSDCSQTAQHLDQEHVKTPRRHTEAPS